MVLKYFLSVFYLCIMQTVFRKAGSETMVISEGETKRTFQEESFAKETEADHARNPFSKLHRFLTKNRRLHRDTVRALAQLSSRTRSGWPRCRTGPGRKVLLHKAGKPSASQLPKSHPAQRKQVQRHVPLLRRRW